MIHLPWADYSQESHEYFRGPRGNLEQVLQSPKLALNEDGRGTTESTRNQGSILMMIQLTMEIELQFILQRWANSLLCNNEHSQIFKRFFLQGQFLKIFFVYKNTLI